MKQITYLFFSLSLSLSACSDYELENEVQNPKDGFVHIVEFISPVLEEDFGDTRGLTYTGSGVPFTWVENDVVGIFPDRGDQISFSMADGVGTTSAILDGGAWALKSDAQYGAYYPFDKKNFFTDRSNIILDYTGQCETGIASADHLASYDFQAANFASASNGKLMFDLKRLGCVLILRLTVPQAGTYTDLYLSADHDVFTEKAKLSLGESYQFVPIEKTNVLHLSLKDVTTTTNNQVADFLIMLAPVDLTGDTFTATLKGANGYLYKGMKAPTSAYSANKVTRTSITLKLDGSSNIGFGGEFTTEESSL